MEFDFRFPYPSGVLYDHETGITYIWGDNLTPVGLMSSISHETLHCLISQIMGNKASIGLDKIARKVKSWNKTVHYLLY